MSKHDDWFDDFMAMKMMEEDEKNNSNDVGGNRGCLPGILVVLAILFIIFSLFD
jgi:hypothetical protein